MRGFGKRTSTKTIAGKPFGRRRVKWWLSVRNMSDARYITSKLRTRMREKPLLYLRKYNFSIYLKTWATWFSKLFIVFSFRFIELIANCRQSSRVHYRTLTGSILRKTAMPVIAWLKPTARSAFVRRASLRNINYLHWSPILLAKCCWLGRVMYSRV